MSPQPHISIIPPPGPFVLALRPNHHLPPSSPPPPPLFLLAHAVRIAVFVDEQKCSADEEIDADDPISWHWIAFAPVNPRDPVPAALDPARVDLPIEPEIAAATIRLIPVAATRHPEPHAPDHQGPAYRPTRIWDGVEPYVKLGRLATVSSRRGLGLGIALVHAALTWAAGNKAVLRGESGGAKREPKRLLGGERGAERERGGGNGWDGLVLVHAQLSAEKFWVRAGFVTDPGWGTWFEEGIEHVAMWKRVSEV